MESKSGRGRKRQSLQVRVTDKGQQVNQAHDAYMQKSDYLHSLDVELLLEDKENPCPHPEMLKASLTLKKQCFIDVRFTSDGLFAFTLGRVRIDPEGFGRYEDQELDKLKVFVTVGNSKDWLYRKHLTLEQSREELVTRESYQRLTDEEKELLMWLSQQMYKARLEFRQLFSKNPDNSNQTKSKIAKARFEKLREVKEQEEFERYATKLVSSSRQVCGGSIVMGIVLERTIDALIEKGFPKRFISGLLDFASGMLNFKNFSATPLHHQRLGQNQALYCIDGFTRNFYVDNWVLTEELRLNLGIGDCQNLAPQELMDVFTSTMFQARPQLTDACVNLATDVTSLK